MRIDDDPGLESQRSAWQAQLREQVDSVRFTSEQLRRETASLATALRRPQVRGRWGELHLQRTAELAGMVEHCDFDVQVSAREGDQVRRPDMLVRLAGGKTVVIDAKVPLDAYLDVAQADDEDEAAAHLRRHARQVRSHVDALASKSYWTGLEASPDFTIAFIPNEPLLAAAMETDPNLMDYAFSKRIILANPGTLWALLKTIAFTWQQDVLTEDAKRLFDLGKELYGRLATLAEHADRLRGAIESTVNHYNKFASSLEQRVLVTARKLDALDESKVIGEPRAIDETPKHLTQNEFAALDELGVGRPELELPEVRGGTADPEARQTA